LVTPSLSTGVHRETRGSTPSVWYVTASLAALPAVITWISTAAEAGFEARYRIGGGNESYWRYPEALGYLTRHPGSGVENLAFLAMTFAKLGRRTEAQQEFANLQRRIAPDQPENSADRRLLREAQTQVEGIVR
jgi:hypothetical protein